MYKQLRLQLDSIFIKVILLVGFLLSLFLSSPARAESILQYIQSLQSIPVTSGGATVIPSSVLLGLTQGALSPVAQYVLVNNIVTNAVNDGVNQTPDARLPFVNAKTRFEEKICAVTKSFQTALVVALLPQTSSIRENGGSSDPGVRQAKQQQALAMAQAFAGAGSCNPASSASGFDPNIITVLQRAFN